MLPIKRLPLYKQCAEGVKIAGESQAFIDKLDDKSQDAMRAIMVHNAMIARLKNNLLELSLTKEFRKACPDPLKTKEMLIVLFPDWKKIN